MSRARSPIFSAVRSTSFRNTRTWNGGRSVDVIIEPDVTGFVWDDFTKTGEMIRAGEEAALKALPAIRAALESKTTSTNL